MKMKYFKLFIVAVSLIPSIALSSSDELRTFDPKTMHIGGVKDHAKATSKYYMTSSDGSYSVACTQGLYRKTKCVETTKSSSGEVKTRELGDANTKFNKLKKLWEDYLAEKEKENKQNPPLFRHSFESKSSNE